METSVATFPSEFDGLVQMMTSVGVLAKAKPKQAEMVQCQCLPGQIALLGGDY